MAIWKGIKNTTRFRQHSIEKIIQTSEIRTHREQFIHAIFQKRLDAESDDLGSNETPKDQTDTRHFINETAPILLSSYMDIGYQERESCKNILVEIIENIQTTQTFQEEELDDKMSKEIMFFNNWWSDICCGSARGEESSSDSSISLSDSLCSESIIIEPDTAAAVGRKNVTLRKFNELKAQLTLAMLRASDYHHREQLLSKLCTVNETLDVFNNAALYVSYVEKIDNGIRVGLNEADTACDTTPMNEGNNNEQELREEPMDRIEERENNGEVVVLDENVVDSDDQDCQLQEEISSIARVCKPGLGTSSC